MATLLLRFIHQQLTKIKVTDDTEVYFGGLNTVVVGDFYQLPPVHDRFVFQNGRSMCQHLRICGGTYLK